MTKVAVTVAGSNSPITTRVVDVPSLSRSLSIEFRYQGRFFRDTDFQPQSTMTGVLSKQTLAEPVTFRHKVIFSIPQNL
jgi:hypothetical protein